MQTMWASFVVLGLTACGGDSEPGTPGTPGTPGANGQDATGSSGASAVPSISGISPAEIFLGYPAVLTISGAGTSWTTAPAVTFEGAEGGIVVDSVQLASPTALVVSVHAESTARFGPRTVRVGTESFAGFAVSPDLRVEYVGEQPLRAGESVAGVLTGRNPLNPFLPTYATSFTAEFLQNGVAALPGDTLSLGYGSLVAQGSLIPVTIRADVGASGTYDFDLVGPDSSTSGLPRPRFAGAQLVTVAAAEPTVVTQFPVSVSLPGESFVLSKLFQYQASQSGLLNCFSSGVNTAADFVSSFDMLGATGRFGDRSRHAKAGDTLSLSFRLSRAVARDVPDSISVSCTIAGSSVVDEIEPNEITANPLTLGQAVRGSLAGPDDVDVYSVTSTGVPWRIDLARRQASTRVTVRARSSVGSVLGTVALDDANDTNDVVVTLPAGAATLEVYATPATSSRVAQRGGDYELLFRAVP